MIVAGTAAATMLAVAPIAHAQEAGDVTACSDPSLPLSVEEQRLTRAVPQEILRLSRADRFGRTFGAALCQMPSPKDRKSVV